MRIAIVSDLHANLQAWNAVLTDISSSRIDRILCLGDIVGYGPEPAKVLESVHRHVHAIVLGNHDAVVGGKMSPGNFNERAREIILWTRDQVGRSAHEFLGNLPLTLVGEGFRCTHGSFANPAAFDYIIEPHEALAAWQAVSEPLLFVGHSHQPGIHVLGASGTPHHLAPQDFGLESGKRYIVNVGSVGSPRDGDARASYVIYDANTGSVIFRRIPFDLDAFRASVVKVGLNPEHLPSLRRDPRQRLAPVREQLDFSPATTKAEEAYDVVEVGDAMQTLRRSATRWRWLTAAALLLAVAGSVAAFAIARSDRPRPLAIPEQPLEINSSLVPLAGGGSLLPPLPESVGADGNVRPWRIVMSDSRWQSATATAEEFVLLGGSERQSLRLEAPTIRLDDETRKYVLRGEARRSDDFEGHAALVIDILRTTADGTGEEWVENYESVEFRRVGGTGWEVAQRTRDLPKSTRQIRIAVAGSFRGSLTLRNLRLTPANR